MSESRESLMREFQDEEYRYAYAEDFLNTYIATQIIVLREQRGLSQSELGALIGTKQPGVSRLEDVNHSTWKTETLKRIARALGVRLRISFETFGTLIEEDESFSREALHRPEFSADPDLKRRPYCIGSYWGESKTQGLGHSAFEQTLKALAGRCSNFPHYSGIEQRLAAEGNTWPAHLDTGLVQTCCRPPREHTPSLALLEAVGQ